MATDAYSSPFAAHCLRIFVRDIVSGRPPPISVATIANRAGIPESLFTAIWLIERNRHPAVISFLENGILRFNAVLCALLGVPVLDLSVGPFQLKVSRAAQILGLPASVSGCWVRFPLRNASDKSRLIRMLWGLHRHNFNGMLAARHISDLHRKYFSSSAFSSSGNHFEDAGFVRFLGSEYNDGLLRDGQSGFLSYSRVLEAVAQILQAPSTRLPSPSAPLRPPE
jgi:hypothetical protein